MKKIILVLQLSLSIMLPMSLLAAPMTTDKSANLSANVKSATNTEHNFEDMLVQGKFHFSDEAVTTVEEDKVLDSLIGVRKDFKDRLLMSTTQF